MRLALLTVLLAAGCAQGAGSCTAPMREHPPQPLSTCQEWDEPHLQMKFWRCVFPDATCYVYEKRSLYSGGIYCLDRGYPQ